MKSKMDGTQSTTLVSTDIKDPCKSEMLVLNHFTCSYTGDVSVDWIGRKVYWTDFDLRKIEVMDMNGGNRKIIVQISVDNPMFITVDPTTG